MGEVKPMIADTSRTLAQQQTRRERELVSSLTAVMRLRYRAVWRSKQLLILPINCHPFRQSVSAVLEGDRDHLFTCLDNSPVTRLLLSSELPVEEICFWAELGSRAKLAVYLQRAPGSVIEKRLFFSKLLRHLFSRTFALGLIFVLSPTLLITSLGLLVTKGQVFERSLCVGLRGLLYWELRFAVESGPMDIFAPLARLPRLFNVFLGEVSLSGSHTEILGEDMISSSAALKI